MLQQASYGLRDSTGLKMRIHVHFFGGQFRPIKQAKLIWFSACDQGSLVGLCRQDYKSLCAAAMICATLVIINTHDHTHTDSILTSLYEKISQLSYYIQFPLL